MEQGCNKVIFIVGPTGVGKTELGIALARVLPCEFISADSMQVYQEMDIITDKLPQAIRVKHPHHLIDILKPNQEYSVADFCKVARPLVKSISARGKFPVVIGGTGLYVNSLVYGIFGGSSKNNELREELKALAEEKGSGVLYGRLNKIDPDAALKISASDTRRVIRALEVFEMTKRPISVLQKERSGLKDEREVLIFGLRRERRDLYRRIDQRVDFMVNAGLLDEVRNLLKMNLSKTASCCIGIKEIEGYFNGEYDLEEAVRLIKRNTRHFAKRQMTWFNKNMDIEWLDLSAEENIKSAAEKICDKVESAEE